MQEIRYWMSKIDRYEKDPRLKHVAGKEEIASLRMSLEGMAEAAKLKDVDELLYDIDAGIELPYGIAEHATDRIIRVLIRVLELMLPPDPTALTMETVCADLQSETPE